ncbi:hypothetical protein IW261DRAFT_1508607 [Armillaria novae-zelandiae]|uniref:F-box domain-containing protein n=1 Tax=Armillaria novae-zelandiae TaxID=153914 RepID=A0AA39NV37_9AGAR|nr:hypothetical protein IW261DRAFT_1508607 [Armillaria novae-zelandiae]
MACALCNANENLDYYSSARKTYGYSLKSCLESSILSNATPSRDDCVLIKDSLSSLSAKSVRLRNIIAQQDDFIGRLSFILHKYEDSREEMLSEEARVHDLLERHRSALSSPIRRLPIDIMREIFSLASSNAADVTDIAWVATHTCTEWRDIATQTPTLWSKIHVTTATRSRMRPDELMQMPEIESLRIASPGASNEECVGRTLELSRDLPLVVSFIQPLSWDPVHFWKEDVEMLDLLLDHSPRWKAAYLYAHHGGNIFCDKLKRMRGRVRMLESVSIETPSLPDSLLDLFQVAPRLRTIAISGFRGRLAFPWQQIRKLILNGLYDMSYFLHVLHSAKNVEHLTICPTGHPLRDLSSDTMDAGNSIILPAVHTLDVLSILAPLFLPSEMILPALKNLRVGQKEPESRRCIVSKHILDIVGGVLRTSGCVLTHATFLPIVNFGPAFQDVISHCTTLTYLDVGFTPPRENIDDIFLFINRPSILPSLRTLKITFSNCNISEDSPYIGGRFVETVLSRKDCLRVFEGSVYIKADEALPYTPILSPADREYLEELKAEGISITVR